MNAFNTQDTLTWLAILSAIILTAYFLIEANKRPKQTEYETKELLTCVNCDYTIEASFEPGDFIGMVKGKCPKCEGPLIIKAIYDVEKETGKNLKAPTLL